MRVRFLADADLNHVIVLAVVRREPSVDFQPATAARLAGLRDAEVLALAAKEGRVLVTHDQTTMPVHFASFVAASSSPGVLIVPQHVPANLVVDDLLLVWHASDAEEWTNRIRYLPL